VLDGFAAAGNMLHVLFVNKLLRWGATHWTLKDRPVLVNDGFAAAGMLYNMLHVLFFYKAVR
jgi:hypothetical protein